MSGRRSRRGLSRDERARRRRMHARICVSCRRVRPKAELIRIVRTAAGEAALDRTGTVPGRGAYVCADEECVALVRRRLGKALHASRIDVEALVRDLEAVTA